MFRHAEIRWSATFSHSHKCLGAVPMPIEYPRITLWLWLTVCHGFSMALIEIDDFPSERSRHLFWGFSMAMLNHSFFFSTNTSRITSGDLTSSAQVSVTCLAWLGVNLQGCGGGGGSSSIETPCSESMQRGQCSRCMCALARWVRIDLMWFGSVKTNSTPFLFTSK